MFRASPIIFGAPSKSQIEDFFFFFFWQYFGNDSNYTKYTQQCSTMVAKKRRKIKLKIEVGALEIEIAR